MGAVVGMRGFGCRNTTRDRLTIVSGAFTYSTSSLPTDSLSDTALEQSTANSHCRAPFYTHTGSVADCPTDFWFHARIMVRNNTANNDLAFTGVGRNATRLIGVSAEDSTNRLTIVILGTVKTTASSFGFSVDVYDRIHIHVTGFTAGSLVNVYANGSLSTPVATYTLNSTDATNLAAAGLPNEMHFQGHGSSPTGMRWDDAVVWDPAGSGSAVTISQLAEMSIKEMVPTGNGPEQDWAGNYTNIDERPSSDADKITATAVGNVSSFTKAAVGADNVFAVQAYARVTRSDATAGANISVRTNDGTNTDDRTGSAPGDGDVTAVFQRGPDGNVWSAASFDAVRIGFVAVT